MSGYIGTQPVPQATQTRDSFTATSGQTSFATGGYTPNFLDVYLNGVKLASADYTATNGSDVVLASGASTGDILEVVAFTTFTPANIPSGTPSIDDNGNATALTIDSSENVMVGGTSAGGNSTFTAYADGQIHAYRGTATGRAATFTATTSEVGYFNRLSTDGDIVQFAKDGNTVGSIGVEGADLTIGTGTNSGLQFFDGGSSVRPFNMASNSRVDNAIDLGESNTRFKDAYLSGGVFLGGTGSANKLDDYEEGTWTPTQGNVSPWSSPTFSARYTKIGRLVRVQVEQTGGTIGMGGYMGGLPFNPSTAGNKGIGNAANGALNNLGTIFAYAQNQIWIMTGGSNQTNLIFGITYFTDD